ncbi:MAG: hypothetical protein ACFFE8_17015, partial [Candidatus Heimdallarchaeota archaeon]
KLRPSYYRGASAIIILFDKGDRSSFEAVSDWFDEIKQYLRHVIPTALVGIKSGVDTISTEEGERVAQELGFHYFESLPNSKIRVFRIFKFLVRKIIEKKNRSISLFS